MAVVKLGLVVCENGRWLGGLGRYKVAGEAVLR